MHRAQLRTGQRGSMFPHNTSATMADVNATMVAYELVNQTAWTADDYVHDRHALFYIVVVLSFYSLGISAAMITYLRRERMEMEEEKTYGEYFTFRNRSETVNRYFQVQRTMNTLNDIGTPRVDKHPDKTRPSGTTHTPMSILHTNKNGRFVPKGEITAETTLSVLIKNQNLLSRVSEDSHDTSVTQVSCVNA